MHRTFIFQAGDFETGNFLELTRVDNFYIKGFPVRLSSSSLRIDSLSQSIPSQQTKRGQMTSKCIRVMLYGHKEGRLELKYLAECVYPVIG